jgi:CBS domain-containing protein
MEKDVPTITDSVTVVEAAKAITESDKGFLIILSGGQPKGIVTEYDFVHKILALELDPKMILISQIMSSPLVSIDPDADLLKASQLMHENNVKRLPVIKDDIIYGIITSEDIATRCGDYVDKTVRDIIRWTAPLGI